MAGITEIHVGEKYIAVKEQLNDDMAKMKAGVEDRIYRLIASGGLTPEIALQAWYEMHSYHRLAQKFNQKAAAGASSREHLAKVLNQ